MIDTNKIIDAAKNLFPFPLVARKLLMAIETDASAEQITRIASLDPSITVNIITMANSPFYAARKQVTDIIHATTRLGFETVRQIAITKGLSNLFSRTDLTDKLLWEHSIAVSILNKQLARRIGGVSESTAYTIGLLHDFGKVIFKRAIPEDYNMVLEICYNENKEFRAVELDILGMTHDHFIGEMAKIWNLGDIITTALSNHHGPYDIICSEASSYAPITALSDAIANSEGIGRKKPLNIDIEKTEPFKLTGIDMKDVKFVREKSLKEFKDTINFF